ncbi:MAG TPA: DNA mismatch repair endonuclease MutL [Tissierellia bacterium]|nr:DNA mismatch repair endonuclease MutL [Tissierellia bacterium]
MTLIRLLDNETINKIAAGEVIESPKSIVKELVENSVDAGADEITIEIKNGGKTFIRVSDNGRGIDRDQVENAFKRHCTSKISSSEDLNSLFTLGFRGEALASIAAVSRLEIITRTQDDIFGLKMTMEGGIINSKEDIGCPVGTTITVTDLFFNVPARKKFLKSDISESSSITDTVMALALSREYISFKYINNNNMAFRTPKTTDFINTISSLYEKDLYNSLLRVDYKSHNLSITGYTTDLNYYRGNRKLQLVFVNGRVIKHKRINYFIEAAYETLLPKDKHPACFLRIDLVPSLVDVNVHPAKTEVRFQNEDLVLNEVKNAVYSALHSTSIMKEVKKDLLIKEPSENTDKTKIFDKTDNLKISELGFTKGNIFEELIKEEKYIPIKDEPKTYEKPKFEQETFIMTEREESRLPDLSLVGIVMDTYIICENYEKTQMFMIDQHAAHERINYEKFLKQYKAREILIQEIIPEVINLSYDDYHRAMSGIEIFKDMGITVESFGNNAVLITSIPAIFKDSSLKDVFYSILDSLKEAAKLSLDLVMDRIIKNACTKSVKSGDKLHRDEALALLKELKNTVDPYTCPHGRPVIIKMTRYEIEKMFGRIQG